MADVIVAGFPQTVKLPKIVYLFKLYVNKFWIREQYDIPNTNLKEVVMEFDSLDEARAAHSRLKDFEFRHQGQVFLLTSRIVNLSRSRRSPSPRFNGRERRKNLNNFDDRSRRYSPERYRSRSPHYDNESSKLDLEIELLRKQRQVIEEERKLLLERKKLELVKEYGPSAALHLRNERDEYRSHSRRERVRPERRRPERPYPTKPPSRPYPTKPPARKMPKNSEKLPLFYNPCKDIIGQMQEILKEVCEEDEIGSLHKHLRLTLRRRLAVALEDKKYMASADIVKLYRKLYPISGDKDLALKLVKDMKEAQVGQSIHLNVENDTDDIEAKDDVGDLIAQAEMDNEHSDGEAALSLNDDWLEQSLDWDDIEGDEFNLHDDPEELPA